jgi:tetratricopeptide (TPR) repeat protein
MEKEKVHKFIYIFVFLAIIGLCLRLPAGLAGMAGMGGTAETGNETEIFNRAKLALFDRKWDQALAELNRLQELFPSSSYYSQVLFYKGNCFEEKKMPKKALENYNAFLNVSRNESLKEEATRSIIDLNFILHERTGEKKYLERIIRLLESRSAFVRYYAAFKLSYLKNKSTASRAVPVLNEIIKKESDRDLVDRARLALMRIDPDFLKKSPKPKSLEGRILRIQVYDKKTKRTSFSFNFPFMLARLALDSLPEKEKKLLRDKGYDLDKIVETLVDTGEILRIENKDGVIKIWIE